MTQLTQPFNARWMMNGLSQYGLFNLSGNPYLCKQIRYSVQRRTDALANSYSGLIVGFTSEAPASGQTQDFAGSTVSGGADSTTVRTYRKTAAAWWNFSEELYGFERYDVAGHQGVVTLQNPLTVNPGFGLVFFGRAENDDCQVQLEISQVS